MAFYNNIATLYDHIFPANNQQLTFIKQAFSKLNNNDAILDIGCGVGTLLMQLNKHYSNLYGIDLNKDMLAIANSKKYNQNPVLQIASMLDMQNLFQEESFNGIVCFGNTLVHLSDMRELESFFQQSHSLTQKDGKLLVQVINYDRIFRENQNGLPTIDNDTIKFERTYKLHPNSQRIDFVTTLLHKETGNVIKSQQELVGFNSIQLKKSAKIAGYTICNLYGSFNGDKFTQQSPMFIMELQK